MKIAKATAVLLLLLSTLLNVVIVGLAVDELHDFGSFAASGINAARGENPYDSTSPLIFEAHFPSVGTGGKLPNLNPPVTLLFFSLLTNDNVDLASGLWRTISGILYIAVILVLAKRYRPDILKIIWSLALAGIWHTIGLGQIYVPLLALVALIWITTEKNQHLPAGILLGMLISIKPNFLIWLLIILASKNWKMSLTALATAGGISLVPLFVYGIGVYAQWLDAARVGPEIIAMPGNSSFAGFLSRIGLMKFSSILELALLTPILFVVYRKKASAKPFDGNALNELGLILSLLMSPISWAGYTILLLPVFLSRKVWSWAGTLSAAMLATPFTVILNMYTVSRFNFIFWGWFYGWALTLCLLDSIKNFDFGVTGSRQKV